MVLGELPVPGRPTIWMIVGQGPIVLAVGAGGGCLDIFTLLYLFSSLSPSLWETARYRLSVHSRPRPCANGAHFLAWAQRKFHTRVRGRIKFVADLKFEWRKQIINGVCRST